MIKCTAGLPRPRREDLVFDATQETESAKNETSPPLPEKDQSE